MHESNLRGARTLTQGQPPIKFAVCESAARATGKRAAEDLSMRSLMVIYDLAFFSIINGPLSLWPTSQEKKLASDVFYALGRVNGREAARPQSDWTSAVVTSRPGHQQEAGRQQTWTEHRM